LSPWPEEKIKFRKPQNMYEWSVWSAGVLIAFSMIAKYIFVHSKSQLSTIQLLVLLISLIGWTLMLVTVMRAGVRLLRSNTTVKRGRIFIIAAGCLFLLQIGGSTLRIYAMSYMTGLSTQLSQEVGMDIPKTLALPDLAPESRELLGRSYAQIKYIQDGAIIDYVTATGAKEVYKPTDEDVLLRNNRVLALQGIRYEKLILAYWCVLFIITSANLLRKKKA
jgi:hypothetical protein